MSTELLINITPQETRVAFVENGVLQEVYIERVRHLGLVGNIYQGKVSRVLPGMEAAFVDIGLDRAAFLHVSDLYNLSPDDSPPGSGSLQSPLIGALLSESQQLLVQAVKDPLGTKGARLTTRLSVPSRYLVLVPGAKNVGVSTRIDDSLERERLRAMVGELGGICDEPHGFIVRTAAEGISFEDVERDMRYLRTAWKSIQELAAVAGAGERVYAELPLMLRVLRDLGSSEAGKIRVDSRENLRIINEFIEIYMPELADRVEHYSGDRPIFDLYGVEDEIQKALDRRVQLKSGGHVVFDQTEAMTTVDVNTGGFVGHRNLEETILKTNLEAAQAIARQLRLRNLGGIIIIDFIDMRESEHRRQVMRVLERALERDHARTQILEVSNLGLVEMTRKRIRESLEHVLCEPCPTCGGRGSLKTSETVCYELFREILRESRQFEARELLVLASQEVIDCLLDEESTNFAELQEFIGIPVRLQVEASYNQEQFDVVPL